MEARTSVPLWPRRPQDEGPRRAPEGWDVSDKAMTTPSTSQAAVQPKRPCAQLRWVLLDMHYSDIGVETEDLELAASAFQCFERKCHAS